ncbi:hypothetical protein AAFF_G00361820 [Aldrovandia affinis]|uniref:Uncharacterized protein n=1 Tax=Aldrovandia affinis TaxID=143900 RepID=A0AAD7WN52_9TELE|nr:hypothetical protein AAFF_G00361820 [Aldrovandia affinis]
MTSIKRSSPGAITEPQTPSPLLFLRRNATLASGSGIELRKVEEAIRELEEMLGVQRRRKTRATERATSAEMQGPAVRQERAPEQPDGASVVRPTRLAMASTSVPANTQPKLARYSGAAQWEPYLAQLQLAARDLKALTTALARRFGQRRSIQASRERLTNCCGEGGESWGTVAADVRFHTGQGYPSFGTAEREELALHTFLQALTPSSWPHPAPLRRLSRKQRGRRTSSARLQARQPAPASMRLTATRRRRKSAGHAHPRSSDDNAHRRYDVAAATAVTNQDT